MKINQKKNYDRRFASEVSDISVDSDLSTDEDWLTEEDFKKFYVDWP